MSQENQNCPKCHSAFGYPDRNLWICPECFHEWTLEEGATNPVVATAEPAQFRDVNGVVLNNGDTVATVKDLKLGKETIKSGTKAKNIKLLTEPIDGHDISCKIQGLGSMYLKCSVVKKVQ